MTIHKQYDDAVKHKKEYVNQYDDLELAGVGRAPYANDKTKSKLQEGSLATTQIESAVRVTSPLPTGAIIPSSKSDRKTAWLLNKVIKDYVLPNANTQFDHDIKVFMVDWASRVYGDVYTLMRWIDNDNYNGPDYEIINPRHIFPAAGITNIEQSPYFFHLVYMSREDLENITKKQDTSWKKSAIRKLLKEPDSNPRENQDNSEKNAVDITKEPRQGVSGEFAIVTKYSKNGTWETFARDYEEVGVLRSLQNKKMPILWKHTLPSITSSHSIGPIERGLPKQKSTEKLVNLFLDGSAMHVFPPRIFNSNEKTSSLNYQAGVTWKLKYPNDYRTDRPDPTVLNNFLSMYQFLKASMLNNEGNTTTQISGSTKIPQFGKTPKALAMQSQRESTFDHLDRRMLESWYTKLIQKFVEMIQEKQVKPISLNIYDADVKQAAQMGIINDNDIIEPYDENTKKASATLTIPKNEFKGKFVYKIDNDQQTQDKQKEQFEAVLSFINQYTTNPNYKNLLSEKGKDIDIAELTKRLLALSGIDDIDEVLVDIQNMGDTVPPSENDSGQTSIPSIDDIINEVTNNGQL